MTKETVEHPNSKRAVAEVIETPSVREVLARGAILFGSACIAVGGVIGYAIGYLDGLRSKKEDDHEV